MQSFTLKMDFNVVQAENENNAKGAKEEFNGNYYQYFDESMTWEEANAKCEELGGHLATITSQDEQDFIYSLIKEGTKNDYFLGGLNPQENIISWTTEENAVYSNWNRGEPNDSAGYYEQYIEIIRNTGKWNDTRNYLLDQNGFICEWEGITYTLKAYTAYPGSTIGTDQEVKVMFKLFENSNIISLDAYNLDIENTNIVEFVKSQKSNEYQIITIKGVTPGATTITLSDGANRANISLSVTVDNSCDYYRCSAFPIPYGSSGGLYVENYNCTENTDGTHDITFDAYNTTYAYGVVAVYDENGSFIKCGPLSPLSDGTGMEKVVNSFKYVWCDIKDIFDGDSSWYTKESNAHHTPVILKNIPRNSEIVITADGNESMYPTLYTGVDVFVQTVFAASSIDIKTTGQRACIQELVKNVIESVPDSVIQSVTKELSTLLIQGITKESSATIYEMVFNMFLNAGINFGDIIKSTLVGIGYGAADALVTTAIPAYKIVGLVDLILEISWPIVDYSYNYDRGKLEIHTTSHGLENYLSNSSISVSQKDNFDINTILDAYLVTKEEELKKIAELVDVTNDNYSVYNITLRENGVEVQPQNKVEVKIPTTDRNVTVYRVENDNSLTKVNAIYVDGYMVFETNHFCYWMLINEESSQSKSLLGDGNGDGEVTIADVVLTLRVIAESLDEQHIDRSTADVDADGDLTTADVITILRHVIGAASLHSSI